MYDNQFVISFSTRKFIRNKYSFVDFSHHFSFHCPSTISLPGK